MNWIELLIMAGSVLLSRSGSGVTFSWLNLSLLGIEGTFLTFSDSSLNPWLLGLMLIASKLGQQLEYRIYHSRSGTS